MRISTTLPGMLACAGCVMAVWAVPVTEAAVLFRDDFSGALRSNWNVVREDAAYYALTPTYLDLRMSGGDLYWNSNNAKNVFLVETPTSGDFTVTMRIEQCALPSRHPVQVDLVAYDDDDNHVRSGYAFLDNNWATNLFLATEVSGAYSFSYWPTSFGGNQFYLRLSKEGTTYKNFWSTDGTVFTQQGSTTYGDGTPERIGFVAMADSLETTHVLIDYFEVTPEPGALSLLALGGLAVMRRKRR
jgi:alpha-glucuronidase